MVKTLLEGFTEQDTKQQQKKKRTVNRQTRGKGSGAEGLLIRQRGALSLFRSGVRTMSNIPDSATVLCYLRMNETWMAYQWHNGTTAKVESVIKEET